MIQAQRAKHTVMLNNDSMTNSATNTANLDCQGSSYATIAIMLGVEANTNAIGPLLSLLESDDTVVTNFATITADRSAEDITTAKEVRYEVDMKGRKRFLRLSVTTETTTNDNVQLTALGILTRNEQDPASTTDMGDDVVVIV